ncbi:hypothetical protein KR009_006416 [Drosophila setifemur]|nr:hypothetical protein KR009_006416 [Drosophila setifemur]
MHQIRQLKDILCQYTRQNMQTSNANCEFYSIWKVPGALRVPTELLMSCLTCSEELFPFMLYFVLMISLFGVLHNSVELVRIFREKNGKDQLRMWRPRSMSWFNEWHLRRFRMVGNIVMLNAWTMLLYGLVNVKPSFFGPWMMITGFVMSLDGFVLLMETLYHRRWMSLRTLALFMFPLLNLYCAKCVEVFIERSIPKSCSWDLVW